MSCVNLSSLKFIFIKSSLDITVFLAGKTYKKVDTFLLPLAQNDGTSCCMCKNVQSKCANELLTGNSVL